MSVTPIVTVVGSTNVDTSLQVPHLPGAGETILSSRRLVSPGGKGANQAAAAAWHGANVQFVCGTGTDSGADIALENLRAFGVDLSGVQSIPNEPTGSAVVLVDDEAENLIIVSPGANHALTSTHVEQQLVNEASPVVLTQLETPYEVTRSCATAGDAIWRLLNPAPMSAIDDLKALLDGFNVLIPNRTELGQLASTEEPQTLDEVAACVAALGFAGTTVVTLGAAGAAVFANANATPTTITPPSVSPVDTSGAGDVFCGVFACELSKHGDIELAAQTAVAISAWSTEQHGAQLTPQSHESFSAEHTAQ